MWKVLVDLVLLRKHKNKALIYLDDRTKRETKQREMKRVKKRQKENDKRREKATEKGRVRVKEARWQVRQRETGCGEERKSRMLKKV